MPEGEGEEGDGGFTAGRFEGRLRAAEREIARLPDLYRRVGRIEDRAEDSGNHELHVMQANGMTWKQALFAAAVALFIGVMSAGCATLGIIYATERGAESAPKR